MNCLKNQKKLNGLRHVSTYNSLVELYNEDKYHIEFLNKVEDIVPKELFELYMKVIELSLEAPFVEELNDSYQLAIELLCKSLGFKFDINGKLNSKEEK